MAISTLYVDLLLEAYLQARLESGDPAQPHEIEAILEDWQEKRDLTKPQFKASDYKVEKKEEASASKLRATVDAIFLDLKVLMKEMDRLGGTALGNYDRWNSEADLIGHKLEQLESRAGDLILLQEDADSYLSFVGDDFTDLTKVDTTVTTVDVDPSVEVATLAPTTRSHQPLGLKLREEDIRFAITKTTAGTGGLVVRGRLLDAFSDLNTYWLARVPMSRAGSVTSEILVTLGSLDEDITKLSFFTHSSNRAAPTQVTPLYSTDGHNFHQLPGRTPTLEISDVGTFLFAPIRPTHIKLILVKRAADYEENGNFFFEFGARLIQFYREGFATSISGAAPQQLISRPLFVGGQSGTPIEFSKVALDACECVPDETSLRYFVAVSDDPNVPLTPTPTWLPIDPRGRVEKESSAVIDVGSLSPVVLGDDEVVSLATTDNFQLVQETAGVFSVGVENDVGHERYEFVNEVDRVLDHQLRCPRNPAFAGADGYFLIDQKDLVIWRNIGGKDVTDLVRGVESGWKFEDPYYSCVVRVDNVQGLQVNAGPHEIIVDGRPRKQAFVIPYGTHTVKVLKGRWASIAPGATSVQNLISLDDLYPYNHKALIEGYTYDSSFPDDEKPYRGVDLIAEAKMKNVAPFDFLHNVADDDYTRFAIDYDIPTTYAAAVDVPHPTMLFLVKVDPDDLANETFRIEFKAVDKKFSYMRLRADFETEDPFLTPLLESYRLRLR